MLSGAFDSTCDLFLQVDNEKTQKNQCMCDRLQLSAAILARWRRSVASIKALDLFHWVMHAVLYRCTAVAIKMASKVVPFFCGCFVCCCPGSRWGNTEQAVAQWRHPVASGVALDMPRNAICITPAHRHGYQNGWRMRYICSLLSTFSLTLFIAKDHVKVN
jgi:hypothetical protein